MTSAGPRPGTGNLAFIRRLEEAIKVAKEKKAVFNSRAALGQAVLESGWGLSLLTREADNLFGIKAGKSWKGRVLELPTHEFKKGSWVREVARWRVYESYSECIVDYAKLIGALTWFKDALPFADPPDGNGNVLGWLINILPEGNEPGWATDPAYLAKIQKVLRDIDDLLKGS